MIENRVRTNFYGVNSVPHIIMDGHVHPPYPYYVSRLEAAYNTAYNVPTNAVINLTGNYSPGAKEGTGTLTAEVIATDVVSGTNLAVIMALCENDIPFSAPNGLQDHFWVMRDMLPTGWGTSVSFSPPYPDTVWVTEDFVVDPTWVPENCYLVALLQDLDGLKQIKQSAQVLLSDLTPTDVATDTGDFGLRSVSLGQNFPNPCNPVTVIPVTLSQHGRVTLKIYDVEGREVRTLLERNLAAGTHPVEWDGRDDGGNDVVSGIYYCTLNALDDRHVRKLVVVR